MMKEIHLTPRQEDVLRILRRTGANNKMIAKQLGISEQTVKLHVTALLNKFAVRSRLQLVVLLQAQDF
jgi:two-component system nitrate/nitrite response regulator NarL